MSLIKKKNLQRDRRVLRVRKKLHHVGAEPLPRVIIFKSHKHIYAQLCDVSGARTITACSSLELKPNGPKKTVARLVGKELAGRARAAGVERVVFDRGGCLYHGRVRELADGLREGGITI